MRNRLQKIASALLLASIQAYRIVLSPLLGSNCRFAPSCSVYTEVAVRRFGPWRGAWLGSRRIVRCHPWNPGGHDPVPPAPSDPTATMTRT